jgi:hypothetical protein
MRISELDSVKGELTHRSWTFGGQLEDVRINIVWENEEIEELNT